MRDNEAVRRRRRIARASGELQSAARGGGELPTSRRDVEIDTYAKKPPENSDGSIRSACRLLAVHRAAAVDHLTADIA